MSSPIRSTAKALTSSDSWRYAPAMCLYAAALSASSAVSRNAVKIGSDETCTRYAGEAMARYTDSRALLACRGSSFTKEFLKKRMRQNMRNGVKTVTNILEITGAWE